MDAQSLIFQEKGHLQKWVKTTEQTEQNKRLKGSLSKTSTEAYAGDSGISHVHTQADLVQVVYIRDLSVQKAAYMW